jgi:NTE family protein
MRASMSLPGVFAPVEMDGRVLVDGGVARNIPVDVARSMGAEKIIAVDVGTPLPESVDDLSPTGVLTQTATGMAERNRIVSRAEIGPDDLLIRRRWATSAPRFTHILDTIAIGEAAARAHEAELRRYSVDEATYAAFLKRQRRQAATELPTVQVDAIRLEGFEPVPADRILRRLESQPGRPLDLRALYRDMDGSGSSASSRTSAIASAGERVPWSSRPSKPWGQLPAGGPLLRHGLRGRQPLPPHGLLRRPNVNRGGGGAASWSWGSFRPSPVYQPLHGASLVLVPSVLDARAPVFLPRHLESPHRRGGGRRLNGQFRRSAWALEVLHVKPETRPP